MATRRPWLEHFFGPWILRVAGVDYPPRPTLEVEAGNGFAAVVTDDPDNSATKLALSIPAFEPGARGEVFETFDAGDGPVTRWGNRQLPTLLNATDTLGDIPSVDANDNPVECIEFTFDGPVTIDSIAGGTESRRLVLLNRLGSAGDLTIKNDDVALGTIANRIRTPGGGDLVIANGRAAVLSYSANAARWYVVAHTASSGGGGSPGGSNGLVQFNDSGSFAGDAGLAVNKTTHRPVMANGLELTDGAHTAVVDCTPTGSRTVTLPDATDTLVGRATTDTLTNKTIDADSNALSNIANSAIKSNAGIAVTKLAPGMVANQVVKTNSASTALEHGYIADANVSVSAAIQSTKTDGNFGSQTIKTTDRIELGSSVASGAGYVRLPYSATPTVLVQGKSGVSTNANVVSSDTNVLDFGDSSATWNTVRLVSGTHVQMRAGTGTYFVNGGTYSGHVDSTGFRLGRPVGGLNLNSTPFRWLRTAITKNDATDLTLSSAQYECRVLDVSGNPGGDFAIVPPNTTDANFLGINRTAYNMTLKKSGGTGVVIGPGKRAEVLHSGTDYERVTPDT